MQSHYCTEEHTIITFEGECNWCGMKEDAKIILDKDEKNGNTESTED